MSAGTASFPDDVPACGLLLACLLPYILRCCAAAMGDKWVLLLKPSELMPKPCLLAGSHALLLCSGHGGLAGAAN